jgi:glycosyltransferase involved in cell wall biosynthesis
MTSIWAHTLIKNESKWLWYSVSSVINHIDKLLLWDTGSTDKTREIINELIRKYPDKIEFKEVGNVDPKRFTTIRQQMLDATKSDWFLIVDGDEIWWNDSIAEVTRFINRHGAEYE